jgi:hypothetical protein
MSNHRKQYVHPKHLTGCSRLPKSSGIGIRHPQEAAQEAEENPPFSLPAPVASVFLFLIASLVKSRAAPCEVQER